MTASTREKKDRNDKTILYELIAITTPGLNHYVVKLSNTLLYSLPHDQTVLGTSHFPQPHGIK